MKSNETGDETDNIRSFNLFTSHSLDLDASRGTKYWSNQKSKSDEREGVHGERLDES